LWLSPTFSTLFPRFNLGKNNFAKKPLGRTEGLSRIIRDVSGSEFGLCHSE